MTIVPRRNVVAGWIAPASFLIAVAAIAAPLPANAEIAPASGRMLIASRDLTDPNFSQTVILLVEHGEDGSTGVVINRPTRISPHEALPQIENLDQYDGHIFFGGPVEISSLVLLFRADETPPGATRVLDDIHVSSDATILQELTEKGLGDSDLRLYAGYAGWHAGQLDTEISRGGWHVLPGKADLVFDQQPGGIWKKLLPPPEPILAHARPVTMARRP